MTDTESPKATRRRGRPRSFDRAAALERAMELFWARGFEGASISALAETMGISSPSLYAAFGSKEELFRESVAFYDEKEGAIAERALRELPTAEQAITAMLRANADAYTHPGTPTGCLIVLGASTWTDGNESVRKYLSDLREQTRQAIEARLRRGVHDGDLRPDTDVKALSRYLATVQEGLSLQARDGATRDDLRATIDIALQALHGAVAR